MKILVNDVLSHKVARKVFPTFYLINIPNTQNNALELEPLENDNIVIVIKVGNLIIFD